MLHREKGFTLIELLIVVAIIGIIAAIAVPNLISALQQSRQKRAAADMRAIATALGAYQSEALIFPQQAALGPVSAILFQPNRSTGLSLDDYRGAALDPWSMDFQYFSDDRTGYTLICFGRDNAAGNNGKFQSDIYFINGQFQSVLSVD